MALPVRQTLAFVLVAGSLCLFAADAQASYPGRNGGLAVLFNQFDRGGADDFELRLVTSRGRKLARLGRCSRQEGAPPVGPCPRDPSFSAKGSQVAFELEGRLATARANGSQLATLPLLTDRDQEPYWSPDGKQLVFTGSRGGMRNLYLVATGGTGLRQLTGAGGGSPAWSAGGKVAYVSQGWIYTLDPRTRRRKRLVRGANPDWSPSGRSVAYVRGRNAYRVPVRRGARPRLLVRRAREPVFSPDGKRLLFLRDETPDLGSSVLTSGSDGRGAKVLLDGGELDVGSTWEAYEDLAWRPLR